MPLSIKAKMVMKPRHWPLEKECDEVFDAIEQGNPFDINQHRKCKLCGKFILDDKSEQMLYCSFKCKSKASSIRRSKKWGRLS